MTKRNLVVITRDAEQGASLRQALQGFGYQCLHYPVLRVVAAADGGLALRNAAEETWDWLVLSSANALHWLLTQIPVATLANKPIAVVGEATAAVVCSHGLKVAHIASGNDADSLLSDLRQRLKPGSRILLPQAANARPLLAAGLAAAGMVVNAPVAYQSIAWVPPQPLPLGQVIAVTLASSATVERFVQAVGADALHQLREGGCQWAAIGRHTAATARAFDLQPLVVGDRPLAHSLAEALHAALQHR